METSNVKRKRKILKFSQKWLTDENIKLWIEPVDSDNTMFYCKVCRKHFSCTSRVSRHAKSACHLKNYKNLSTNMENDLDNSRKKKCKGFQSRWLELDDSFRSWLCEPPSDHQDSSFFCKICEKSMAGGVTHIRRHAESETHVTNLKNLNEVMNIQDIDESRLPFDLRKNIAEIRFSALVLNKNVPYQTAKAILNFFQNVGKDPNILANMKMGPPKRNIKIFKVL
ncbi:hypothetical protein PV325_012461 [Microctonus aethiopoides]|uniref:C2H2-type domain-containing protein n=1 Tax=Microctonus aethiopoides TaxID=144406 RepID=A0AA39KSP7_9HYME|nr:hypothetical protein PV325_012461 [Microctonus aethiopoides]KAK0172508.1 hypothetical protein PV328_005816 [Microctonus aethiopoides]